MTAVRAIGLALLLLLVGPPLSAGTPAQSEFQLAGTSVAVGTVAQMALPVPAGAEDPAAEIPLTIIHGRTPGPVLLIVAGVHGYEFASILAAPRLGESIDATRLSGTVIIVNAANVAAFLERAPYVNPYDRKNLNRSFPGKANGTQTERIAWALSTQLIARADFVMDVHSGDGAEWLEPFVGVYGGPLATGYQQALAVARAFAFPNIVRYAMRTQQQIDRGRSLNRQAVAAGVPTVLVEIGQNGSRDPAHVRAIIDGVRRALVVLEMADTGPERPQITSRSFDGESSVPVQHSGIWSPARSTGHDVTKGQVIGEIHDYWGNLLQTVVATISGRAIYGLAGPPVRRGDSVMAIARPVASLESIESAAAGVDVEVPYGSDTTRLETVD